MSNQIKIDETKKSATKEEAKKSKKKGLTLRDIHNEMDHAGKKGEDEDQDDSSIDKKLGKSTQDGTPLDG